MIKHALAAGLVLGALGGAALAAKETIGQKGRRFSADHVTIRKGEALTFLNDDNVPHNVISTSRGSEFDLGSQRPGTATDVRFTSAGEAEVICAIHPRMKMLVTIVE